MLENLHYIIKEECFLFALQVLNLTDPGFWWLLIVLLIIALIAIVVIGFCLLFQFAAFAAIVVFFLTGSLLCQE